MTNRSVQNRTTTKLNPIELIHGTPTLTFSMEEQEEFTSTEGLHQVIVIKVNQAAPDLKIWKNLLPKHFGVKGNCLIGLLGRRQLLVHFDQYDDFVIALSRSVNYLPFNGEEHQLRIFPWTLDFNPKKETSMAAVWISLPNLSPDLFARRALMSIAAAAGKPIAIDKATQAKTRLSTARVANIKGMMKAYVA
nr:uncharacterized protein LOC117273231 isoform X1 [Nicotiana tomentosiformis]